MAALLGVKRRSRSMLTQRIDEHVGHRAAAPATCSMRPATCTRNVSLKRNSLNMNPATLVGAVGIEQAAFDARRGQPLVHALHAERGRQRREAQIERRELHFDAAFLLLVGEGLLDAVEAALVGELVVLVVGVPEPEADRLDAGACGRYSPRLVTLVWFMSMRVLVSVDSRPGTR